MCLAIPMKVVKLNDTTATVELNGVETEVNCMMTPGLVIGDQVLVHAGFIIEKLDPEAAAEIEKTWQEYYDAINNNESI